MSEVVLDFLGDNPAETALTGVGHSVPTWLCGLAYAQTAIAHSLDQLHKAHRDRCKMLDEEIGLAVVKGFAGALGPAAISPFIPAKPVIAVAEPVVVVPAVARSTIAGLAIRGGTAARLIVAGTGAVTAICGG